MNLRSKRHGPTSDLEGLPETFSGFLRCQSLSGLSSSSRVSFNTINRKTGNKVKRQFVDAETGEVVENEDQAKGYPVAKDSYLLIDDEELDKIQIESTHTIDIEKFVPRSEIDPRYLESPYYIAPGERVAEEAFAIIRDAMRDEKVVGLGRVVMARRSGS